MPIRARPKPLAIIAPVAVALVAGCAGPTASASAPAATAAPSPSPTATPVTTPVPSTPPPTSAGRVPPPLAVVPIVDGLDSPVDLATRPGDPATLFVVEQGGRIRAIRDGALLERPVLDIAGMVTAGGEQGLLGLAFHPDPSDARLFVYYTATDESQVLASYAMTGGDGPQADPASGRVLLEMADPFGNHNGGSLAFGPDGYLYIGTGDGGGGGDPLDSGRHLDTLLAKVLRIDVDGGTDTVAYGIPPDNPFVGRADARPEIWHTGLRNPWRMRFDRASGDLWIGDVGQNAWEEIDRAPAGVGGLDFGWDLMEGSHCFREAGDDCATPDLTLPVAEYGHDAGCSVTGGIVYRGAAAPDLVGWYLFSDYCAGTIWAVDADAADPTARQEPIVVAETGGSISAIGEDAAGELFVTDLGGTVLAIEVSASGT